MPFVPGLALPSHSGPPDRKSVLCCLAIYKTKMQERWAHPSGESSIKLSFMGSFKLLGLVKHSDPFSCLKNTQRPSQRSSFGFHLQGAPSHSKGIWGGGVWKSGGRLSMAWEWMVITTENRCLLPFSKTSIKYCLAQAHLVPFCLLCKLNI